MAAGVLLDIEGTTTPISFVFDVLFPFARAHLREAIAQSDIEALRSEYARDLNSGHLPPPLDSEAVSYVEWLMDRDRKCTALKELQARIWQQGYADGVLRGEVFPDVPAALERWSERSIDVRIYSSGSVLAQKLIFSTTRFGDLTRWLKGYFDTTAGPKTEPSSYMAIAQAFGLNAAEIVFISDVTRELDAAAKAGMEVLLCQRPGNRPPPHHPYRRIFSFDELFA